MCNKRNFMDGDFEQLQRSLKRVRLSSGGGSPGELRLQRDLRHAVSSRQWVHMDDDQWRVELPQQQQQSVLVTVSREDSMELILNIHNQQQDRTNKNTITKLHLSFPRRYPHQPPMVRRIEYQPPAVPPANFSISSWHLRSITDRNLLQRILIPATPEEAAEIVAAPGTVVLRDWSPVQRLTDVCEWLVATVLQYQQQGGLRTAATTAMTSSSLSLSVLSIQSPSSSSHHGSSITSNSTDEGQSTPVHRNGVMATTAQQQQALRMETSHLLLDDDDARDEPFFLQPMNNNEPCWNREGTIFVDDDDDDDDDFPMMQASAGASFLPPGRFNLGYEREQQQQPMMDFDDDL